MVGSNMEVSQEISERSMTTQMSSLQLIDVGDSRGLAGCTNKCSTFNIS